LPFFTVLLLYTTLVSHFPPFFSTKDALATVSHQDLLLEASRVHTSEASCGSYNAHAVALITKELRLLCVNPKIDWKVCFDIPGKVISIDSKMVLCLTTRWLYVYP